MYALTTQAASTAPPDLEDRSSNNTVLQNDNDNDEKPTVKRKHVDQNNQGSTYISIPTYRETTPASLPQNDYPRRNTAAATIRLLARRYPLTRTAYKFVEIGINAYRPARVEIALGDIHGKELTLTPIMWNLLKARPLLVPHFQTPIVADEEGIRMPPPPVYITDLTLRCNTLNNLKVLRFDSRNARMTLSGSTVLGLFSLEHCINLIVDTLTPLLDNVDNKLARFRDIAAKNPKTAAEAISNNPHFVQGDLIDCELLALFIEIALQ